MIKFNMIAKTIFLIVVLLIYFIKIVILTSSIFGLLSSVICAYLFLKMLKSYDMKDNILKFLIKTIVSFGIIMINFTIINYRKYNNYLQQTTYNNNIINESKSYINKDQLRYFYGSSLKIDEKIHNDMLDFMVFKKYYDNLGDLVLKPYSLLSNNKEVTTDFLEFRKYIKNKNYNINNTKHEEYSIFSYQMLKIKMFLHYIDQEYTIVQDICSMHNIIEINDINHSLMNILSHGDKSLYTLFKNRFKNQGLFGLSY